MVKPLIIVVVIFAGILSFYGFYVVQRNRDLYKTVKADFTKKYPDYEFIEYGVGEGDAVVAYVHVRFKKTDNDSIHEEVWQYWDLDSDWVHRDRYLELTK